jgi:hypothetical protein
MITSIYDDRMITILTMWEYMCDTRYVDFYSLLTPLMIETLKTRSIVASGSHIQTLAARKGSQSITIDAAVEVSYLLICDDVEADFIFAATHSDARLHLSVIMTGSNKISLQGLAQAPGSYLSINILAIASDGSDISLDGGICLDVWAYGSEWYLTEQTLLVGEPKHIRLVPQLDVRVDDVKASHGASIARIDAKSLFYAQSRWLTRDAAYLLLLQGMVTEALAGSDMDDDQRSDIRDRIIQKALPHAHTSIRWWDGG